MVCLVNIYYKFRRIVVFAIVHSECRPGISDDRVFMIFCSLFNTVFRCFRNSMTSPDSSCLCRSAMVFGTEAIKEVLILVSVIGCCKFVGSGSQALVRPRVEG